MSGIGIGVKQRNRDGFGAEIFDAVQQCWQLCFIQGDFGAAIGAQTLLHTKAPVAWDQGWEGFLRQAVNIASDMAVDFQYILKPCRG